MTTPPACCVFLWFFSIPGWEQKCVLKEDYMGFPKAPLLGEYVLSEYIDFSDGLKLKTAARFVMYVSS